MSIKAREHTYTKKRIKICEKTTNKKQKREEKSC
jgi:hypothetical protein